MIAGVSAVTFNAQTTWDFNDATKFTGTAFTSDQVIQGLTFKLGTAANITGFNSQGGTFSDGYAPTQRLQMGGVSYANGTNDPTASGTVPFVRRYIEVPVPNEPVRIKVWARGGGAGRKVIVHDGTAVVGSIAFTGSSATDTGILSADYSGNSSTLYVGNAVDQNSIFKIEIQSLATLAVVDGKKLNSQVFSSGNTINIKGLDSKITNINVYTATGSLVKSLKSSADTNFEINTKGLYIVNLKSEAGEKSVKVLVK
ncbi:T9SS type A sorting domain-containing protein [Chryseobacterium sp. FH1]|uniref:T9SS type A sorting domain-containing protein n=1 Tax=Chryseobacterium sp. FH1 TaxID=1233951 RepID=UPI0013F3C6C4|nr:T9SS type A sorting domain-containing protein [Chryseobacterium sp. FH1]